MYFTIRDVWQHGQSMYGITSRYQQEKAKPSETSLLLACSSTTTTTPDSSTETETRQYSNPHLPSHSSLKVFRSLTTDQSKDSAGGNDPSEQRAHVEQLQHWISDIYHFLGKLNAARQAVKPWNGVQYEKYVTDNFYAFSRGSMLACFTNQSDNDVSYVVPNSGFS